MKNKILHNPTEVSIVDYEIEEAEEGKDGEVVIDENTGRPKWTGRTLKWSIRVGETLEFPVYVANYLQKIYPFLVEKEAEKAETEKKEAIGVKAGEFRCQYCGKSYTNKKYLGMHIGSAHYDKIIGK